MCFVPLVTSSQMQDADVNKTSMCMFLGRCDLPEG